MLCRRTLRLTSLTATKPANSFVSPSVVRMLSPPIWTVPYLYASRAPGPERLGAERMEPDSALTVNSFRAWFFTARLPVFWTGPRPCPGRGARTDASGTIYIWHWSSDEHTP